MKTKLLSLLFLLISIAQSQYPGWNIFNPPDPTTFTALAVDSSGNKWLGTSDDYYPLYKFNGNSWIKFDTLSVGGPYGIGGIYTNKKTIYVDNKDNIWFGTCNSLSKYDGTVWQKLYNGTNFYSICKDKNSDMWFGTSNGLLKYDGVNWTEFNTGNSQIQSNSVSAVAVDSNNNIWIGYSNISKVSKFNGSTWQHFNIADWTTTSLVIFEPDSVFSNSVYIGQKAYGDSILSKLNPGLFFEHYSDYFPAINPSIANALVKEGNFLWIGTDKGLIKLRNRWHIKEYFTSTNSPLTTNNISAVAVDKNNIKWICADNKLYKYDETPFLKLDTIPDSLRSLLNHSIKWQAGFFNKVKIEYSTNNGESWNLIATDINASQGSYNWQVPVVAPSSSQCKIRISNLSNPELYDESSLFTMYAKVSNPVLSVSSGTYNSSKNVTITCPTTQAEIRYTIDGSEPTLLSQLYSEPVLIDSSQTLKVRAFKTGWVSSDIISAIYLLKAATPTFAPIAGSYSTPQTVQINSVSDSVKIYYTMDGNEPSESSTLYTTTILIDTNKTLKAKIFKMGWTASDTRTGNYSIAGQAFTINFNTPNIWFDTNFDGKESKTIDPTTSISYGSIVSYEWSVGNNVIGTSNSITAELPTGTCYVLLSMTSDRGIIKKDSVSVSVYAAETITSGSIESAVSQLNENIYFVTSKGGSVYRFDSTGTIAWTIQTGGSIQSTTCVSNQDNIYVGSNDTRLYSFDYQGIPRWDKAMGGTIVSSPSTGMSGLIYVGISTGRLFAVDEASVINWSVQTGGQINSSASIDENGVVYFGSNDGKLYTVSSGGTVLWNYVTGGAIRTSPALGLDSSIVFGSDDGSLYKLDRNGNQQWSYQTGGQIKSSPIIGLDGIIYFGSGDGKVYSISKTGSKLWEFNAGAAVNVTPALSTEGSIYFGAMNGTIFALDQSGNKKWQLQTGKPILAPMLVTNSRLIMVGDTLGKVYIMKIPESGSLPKFSVNSITTKSSFYEWWTFKGNNQRTGFRKTMITGINGSTKVIPDKYTLLQNYPNPFNPSTKIRFELPSRSTVKLFIYNMLGQQMAVLLNKELSAGYQEVIWNANVSSGLYFYHIEAITIENPNKRFVETKKMLLLR